MNTNIHMGKKRCSWVPVGDKLYEIYHDKEWGVPVKNDRKIYEFLVLESFQAGLSWRIVLSKREAFRKALAGFDPKKIAKFGKKEISLLMKNSGIVRNKLKIEATINNAKRFLEVQQEFGSFSKYMWTQTDAELWAKDLKKRGFKFLGPVVVYSHMQATGMVNDHAADCFRR